MKKPRETLWASEFHTSKTQEKRPNIGGFAANIACGFLELWTCGTCSLIKFLEVFTFLLLTTARNNSFNFAFYRLWVQRVPKRPPGLLIIERIGLNISDLSALDWWSSTHKASKNPHQQMGGRFAAPYFSRLFSALCVELYQSRAISRKY